MIVYILGIDERESNGSNGTPESEELLQLRVIEINRVLDGDTIDVTIDLGFDLYKKERVRVAGVDTPEKRTRDLEEKALGIDATNWLKEKLEGALRTVMMILLSVLNSLAVSANMVVFLVGYTLGTEVCRSTNK